MGVLLVDIGSYLQSLGHGTLQTDLFLETMPPMPDAAIQVVEYPGRGPEHTMGKGTEAIYENPRINVMVRDIDPLAARTKARAIWRDLDKVTDEVIGGSRYLRIEALQSPFAILQLDDHERSRILFNCEVTRELA